MVILLGKMAVLPKKNSSACGRHSCLMATMLNFGVRWSWGEGEGEGQGGGTTANSPIRLPHYFQLL